MKGVSCLSLGLTFLRPRPLGLLSLHPSHPPAPAQNVTEGGHPGGSAGEESSLDEQREASRAWLRWFGGGEEEGDRCLASASLGPGSRRAWEKKGKREREAGKEGERSGTRRNWLSSGGYWVTRPAEPRGGIFSAFPSFSFSFYLFKPDVNVAGTNMSSIQLGEKSDSPLGLGLATTPFLVL